MSSDVPQKDFATLESITRRYSGNTAAILGRALPPSMVRQGHHAEVSTKSQRLSSGIDNNCSVV